MSTKKVTKMTAVAGECLKKAVRDELRKKALLDQYVIINRDGKPWRVSAKEALKMTEHKGNDSRVL